MPHIYLCERNSKIFMARAYSSHMTSVCQKLICICQNCRNKGLMFQLKRSGTDHAAQKINFLTSIVVNGRPLPL